MPQKLLQKRRKKHLQQTPPENLMPLIPIKSSILKSRKQNQPLLNVTNAMTVEEGIKNQWVLSWNTLKKKHLFIDHSSHSNLEREKAYIVLSNKYRSNHLDTANEKIVEPCVYIWNNWVNRIAAGDMIEILNQFVSKKERGFLGFYSYNYKNKKDSHSFFSKRTLRKEWALSLDDSSRKEENPKNFYNSYILWNKISIDSGNNSATISLRKHMLRGLYNTIFTLPEPRSRINDLYKNQQTESRKVGILYGNLSKRTLARLMHSSKKGGGNIDCKFLSTLERRLDVALKRILFFPTIKSARQWIIQGKILVNNQPCTTCGYLLRAADLITIKKEARMVWRREWLNFFHHLENQGISQSSFQARGAARVEGATSGFVSPEALVSAPRKRRSYFSPLLMQKWRNWGVLWGNNQKKTIPASDSFFSGLITSGSSRTDLFPLFRGIHERGVLHKWVHTGNVGLWLRKAHTLFRKSALLYYFTRVRNLCRQETKVTRWLFLVQARISSPKSKEKKFVEMKRGNSSTSLKRKGFQGGALFRRFSQPLRKVIYALLLNQQHSFVTDGLYGHRWGEIFLRKKPLLMKRKDWAFSCMKPMHFECSYKRASAIFLYSPQKLAWPSHINVDLLKKALL